MVKPPLRPSNCCSRGGVGAWSSHLYAPATAAHEEESAHDRATSSTPQQLLLTRRSRRVIEPPLRSSDCCSRGGVGAWSSHLYAPATAAHEEESARDRATSTLQPTAAHEEESAHDRATSNLRPSDCCSRGGVGA